MTAVGVVARVAIGAVLMFAGISKLRTRTWGVLAMESGTPRFVVLTLPAVECLLGAALIIQLGGAWLPWVAVALFVAFTAVVMQRVWSGSKTPCNCFGSKRSQEPVDRMTVARNLVLLVIALAGTVR
jgi:hypothetical protein